MDRRIIGLETEYGLVCWGHGRRTLAAEHVSRLLFRSVVAQGAPANVFLPNGGRLYLDVGSHPEYATAECDRLSDLLAQDRAGERILAERVAATQADLDRDGIDGTVHVFKNNLDSSGNSFGCHENYLIERSTDFDRLLDALVPFLISRQIIAGSGWVGLGPAGWRFEFSQRAGQMHDTASSATTRTRPMVNTRDEPHADADRYRRLHVILGDSSIAEPTTMVKVGATDLVLQMIESGIALNHLAVRDPVEAIRAISGDLTGRAQVRLRSGGTTTAVELQAAYLDAASRFTDRHPTSAMTSAVLDLWDRGIRAVRDQNLSLVDRELDWAIKYRLIERYRDRRGVSLGDPRIGRLQLAYHDIVPEHSLADRLRANGLIVSVLPAGSVDVAMRTPPQTTRARLRGHFIEVAQARGRSYAVDWVHLKLTDGGTRTCLDPFVSDDLAIEEFIEAM